MASISSFFLTAKRPRLESQSDSEDPFEESDTNESTTYDDNSSSSTVSVTDRAKHKIGYISSWQKEWPWILYKEGEGGYCIKHNATCRSKKGVWVNHPCVSIRRDKVKRHAISGMHKGSEQLEAFAAGASVDGGIAQALENTIALKRKAVQGAMRILYWLSKNEVAHFTKFEKLKQLCIDLGCTYLKELNVAGNANYSSHRMISEWLDIMSALMSLCWRRFMHVL